MGTGSFSCEGWRRLSKPDHNLLASSAESPSREDTLMPGSGVQVEIRDLTSWQRAIWEQGVPAKTPHRDCKQAPEPATEEKELELINAMRPTKVNRTSPEAKKPFEQNASSLRGSVMPHPSSPKGSVFPDPTSPRGSVFPDFSSPRGSVFLDPSSPRVSIIPDPSSPRSSLFPDPSFPRVSSGPEPSSPRGSVASDLSTFRSSLTPEVFSPRRSISLNIQSSRDSMGQDSLYLGSMQQIPSKERGSAMKFRVPDMKKKEMKTDEDTPNWPCATLALLLICLLLLPMVSLMSSKVKNLEQKIRDELYDRNLQILRLSEILKQLQVGKVQACTVCKIQWIQRADLCFLLSNLEMSWQSSKGFCLERSSTLAVTETREEMAFLKRESSKRFDLQRGRYRYHKFWIDLNDEEFNSLLLRNKSLLDLKRTPGEGSNLCTYIQNGFFFSTSCRTSLYFICKKRIWFSWN